MRTCRAERVREGRSGSLTLSESQGPSTCTNLNLNLVERGRLLVVFCAQSLQLLTALFANSFCHLQGRFQTRDLTGCLLLQGNSEDTRFFISEKQVLAF